MRLCAEHKKLNCERIFEYLNIWVECQLLGLILRFMINCQTLINFQLLSWNWKSTLLHHSTAEWIPLSFTLYFHSLRYKSEEINCAINFDADWRLNCTKLLSAKKIPSEVPRLAFDSFIRFRLFWVQLNQIYLKNSVAKESFRGKAASSSFVVLYFEDSDWEFTILLSKNVS